MAEFVPCGNVGTAFSVACRPFACYAHTVHMLTDTVHRLTDIVQTLLHNVKELDKFYERCFRILGVIAIIDFLIGGVCCRGFDL